jgi:DNA polymerase
MNGRLLVPMMHPAAGLHQPKNRSLIEDDFRKLPDILAQAEQEAGSDSSDTDDDDPPPAPEQLSMF